MACGAAVSPSSRRCEKKECVFDPLCFPALIKRKTNALDRAAKLVNRGAPEALNLPRRLVVARMDKRGKRQFVVVL